MRRYCRGIPSKVKSHGWLIDMLAVAAVSFVIAIICILWTVWDDDMPILGVVQKTMITSLIVCAISSLAWVISELSK